MAFVKADRVQEQATFTGAGDIVLGGIYDTSYRTFASQMADGDTCQILTINMNAASEWEIDEATYVSSTNSLQRTVLLSSSTGSTVSFTSGVKRVAMLPPASAMVVEDNSGNASVANNFTVGGALTVTGNASVGGNLTVTGDIVLDDISVDTAVFRGATSGTTTVQANGVASGTLTLPAATDTLVGKATTDTLTNKTFNTAGTGNVFQINSNTVSAYTGTGNTAVLSASPTLTGTTNTGAIISTVADGAFGLKVAAATGKVRIYGYSGGNAYIEGVNAAESGYIPTVVTGNPLYLRADGNNVITVDTALVTVSQALNYGGVTLSNSVTGTGSMVLSDSPTFSGNVGLPNSSRFSSTGRLGLSSTALTDRLIQVSTSVTGATSMYGMVMGATVQSDVTGAYSAFYSGGTTASSAFTLPTYIHYIAQAPATFGAGSTVTNQYGFFVSSTTTGATNNYGFYGGIAAGSNRYNLYMAGDANNYVAGSLGIGSVSLTGISLRTGKNITGATTTYNILAQGAIQSDVTSAYYGFWSQPTTAAASFTLGSLIHYGAQFAAANKGAGSTVSNQFGFYVGAGTLDGATTNYGFYHNLASASGVYGFYGAGTAANYFGGATTFNAAITYGGVTLSNSVTGTGSMVLSAAPTITSYADINGVRYGAYTTNASFGGDGSNIAIRTYASGGIFFQSSAGTTWGNFNSSGNLRLNVSTAIPAGGTTGTGLMFSSTANFGVFFGSGAPTLSAAQGSLYVRSDGAPYYNNNGTTGWTQIGAGITAANDSSTASDLYPLFAASATGTITSVYTDNGALNFKPSTGEFTSRVLKAGNGIVVNKQTVASNYTIASGESGMSAGPVSVASGVTVTISSGSRWVVV